MNCPICGAVLNEGAKFCGNCGNKVEAAAPVTEIPVTPAAPATPVEQPQVSEQPMQPVQQPATAPAEQPSIFDQPAQPMQPAAAPAEQPSIFDQPVQPMQPVQPAQQQIYAQPAQGVQTSFAQPQPAAGGFGGNSYIQNNYTQENLQQPEVKKKGKGVLAIVLAVFLILIAVLGVTLFIFRGSLKNTWARLTKSPDEYLKYVITENMDETLDAVEEAQKEYVDILAKMDDTHMEGSVRVEINDEVLDLLEDASGSLLSSSKFNTSSYASDYYDYYDDYYDTDMYDRYDSYDEYYQAEHASKGSGGNGLNLSAYGDIGIVGSYDRKGNLMGLNAGIQVKGGSDILGVDTVFDGDNYTVYGRVPQLNKDYIKVDLSSMLDKNQKKQLDDILSATADLSSATMDPKMMRSMYNRYVDAMLDPVKDVKASKVKLSVNGDKLSCRAYEFTMDDDLFRDILLSVLDELKNDKDLEKWFEDYMDSFDLGTSAKKPDWDDLEDELDKAEKEIKDIKFSEEFTCSFYITNSGKITGFAMVGEDEKDPHFSLAWNQNGTKLDVELTSDYTDKNDKTQFMDIKGGGSVKNGKFSGDFTLDLSLLDDKVEFSLEDVEMNDKKNPGGTFRIGMEQFMNMAGAVTDDLPDSLKKSELVISVGGTLKDKTFSIGLENGTKTVIKLTTNAKLSESQGISVPSAKESVEVDESNAERELVDYLKNSDLEKVVDGLETLGLPDSYADQIRQVTKMLDYY